MKILNPKALAFWTVLAATALAAGAYAAGKESTAGTEITEEESQEVADLIQPKAEAQPSPQSVQGKKIQAPLEAPRARLVTPKTAVPATAPQTTAQTT